MERILIVEDEAAIADSLARFFAIRGLLRADGVRTDRGAGGDRESGI